MGADLPNRFVSRCPEQFKILAGRGPRAIGGSNGWPKPFRPQTCCYYGCAIDYAIACARDPRPSQAPGTTGQEQTRKKQIIRSAATRPPVSKNLQGYAVSAERRKGTGTLTPTLLLIAQELEAQWPLAEYLDTLFF
ncbi:hypothetical protein E4U47_002582 [Claviceps purpurea]|nr:hypothetical protein E4U47_002582 [Claviceps purpurea]